MPAVVVTLTRQRFPQHRIIRIVNPDAPQPVLVLITVPGPHP